MPGALPTPETLSRAWRVLLSTVVIFIAAGYAAALVNVYAQNELVDGRAGLGPRDLILRYAGGHVAVEAGAAPPSRMLEMIQGSMRQYFTDDAHFDVLLDWLAQGAPEAGFSGDAEITPESVILLDCLRCHAEDSGHEIAEQASFGATMFAPEFEQVASFTTQVAPGETTAYRPPRGWRELALTTHVHMLSVPVFVVLMGALFLWATPGARGGWRTLLGAAPLGLFLLDIACWWLARIPEVGWLFALTIGATGALFGATFGWQILVVLRALWRPPRAA